jgi:hypothetical protein
MSFLGILGAIAKPILGPLFGIIDEAVLDKDKAAELKQEIQMAVLSIQEKTLESQRDIIVAEAQGESWIQRAWRPMFMVLLMVSMVVSVVGGMLGYGPAIASGWDSINDNAWLLMQIGLGGYIGGRTVEKTAKTAIKWNSERKG